MKLFTVAGMRAAEESADTAGHPYATMMAQAGQAVAQALIGRFPVANRVILVLVGPGNNGGDGLVAARHLAAAGATVHCWLTHPRDPASDAEYADLPAAAVPAVCAPDDPDLARLRHLISQCDLVVEALLGTGVSRPIGGLMAAVLRTVAAGIAARNAALRPPAPTLTSLRPDPVPEPQRVRVLAVDCPGGLHCDTGQIDPLALSADWTVTFAGPKRGHFLFPGAAACGELIVADIGIDPALTAHEPVEVATPAAMQALCPARPPDGHKGTFGTALIVAGSADYQGAPILAGLGAYRAGCGLVALAVPQALRPAIATRLPEATLPTLPDTHTWSAAGAAALRPHLPRSRALLVGPGLGFADTFLWALLESADLPPLILDADALNILARRPDWWRALPPGTILTPHPGEMARLTGSSLPADRIALALEAAATWQVHLVLKGAHTVVARPDGTATVIPIASAALATAGSGDVLAGLMAGLLARGMPSADAALLGSWLHAAAGYRLATRHGPAGFLAHEIADAVKEGFVRR